jgi:hypothetical protein
MNMHSTPPEVADQQTEIEFTLPLPVAQRLRAVLPWLVRALEDRDTQTAQQRERRREARAVMERLLGALGSALPTVESAEEAASDG